MADAKVTVQILADATRARQGFAEAGKAVGGFEEKLNKASGIAAGALAGVGAAAWDAGKKAAEFADASSAAGVIFGDKFGKEIVDWSKQAATTMGVGQQAAIDAANNFATFGKSAGLAGEDLSWFAQSNAQLAADLASFKGTSPEQAIEALGAAFRGEAEPLRQFGVLLDDASMREEALRMGMIKNTKEALTPQQKVLAAQSLIWNQTSDAQGDFARTSDSVANQQKTMTAQIDNARIAIGDGLQPAMAKILPYLVKAAEWVGQNAGLVLKLAGGIAALSAAVLVVNGVMKAYRATQLAVTTVTKLLTVAKNAQWLATLRMRAGMLAWVVAAGVARAASMVWTGVQWALNAALNANPISLIVLAIAALVAGLVLAYKKSETFRTVIDGVFRLIKTVGIAYFNALRTAIGFVVDKVQALWEKFLKVKNAISNGIGGIVDAITPWGVAPTAAPNSATFTAAPNSATFTAGSRYTASGGGGGSVIVINGALDPVATARQIKRILKTEDVRAGNPNSLAWSAW